MKKLLSLSLVASATILSLNAGAQDLSEAIKDVDISGTIAYRYNDYEDSNSSNNYKMAVNLKSKVNDDVTFNSRFMAGENNATGEASLNTSSDADSNLNVELSEVNFTYTGIANTAITLGKQGVATPFTVHRDALGGETTGTGVLASVNFEPITFAAAYFNQTNLTNGQNDIATVGIMGSFGPVNAEAWYIDIDNTADAYTIAADASFEAGSVTLEPFVRYSESDEDANNKDKSTFKIGLGASVGMFDAFLGYGETDKDGGVDLDGNASDTAFDEHWRISLQDDADSEIIFANAGAQVTDELHVALKYTDKEVKGGTDEDEIYTQITYKMSSNLTTYIRLGEYDTSAAEAATSGRLHVQYSF